MFASTSYSSSGARGRPTSSRREATKKQRRAANSAKSRRTNVRGGKSVVFPPRCSAREDGEEDGEEMEKNPFNIFQPANASTDETVVGAEGVPQFIIEAERKAVPLRRPRLATYAIASSVAAAQLVYILQQSSSLESPILAAASDVCVMIVGSLLWREELRGRAKRLKRIWKEAKERETAMTRAEQGLGETVWTARMRNVNKSFSSSGGKNKTSTTDEQQTTNDEKDYYPTGVTVSELKQSDKQRRVVEVNGKKILLQYFMDELYCVSNKCPHLGISMQGKTALLSAGLEEPKRDGSKAPCIVCPAHQTAFDMESGEVEGEWCPKLPGKGVPVLGKALEKERKPIEVFKTRVEEMTGSILVAVP